jgi:inner membrane protein
MSGKSLHPAQYALVGLAQIIFYLLLLSLAEHLGFDLSFLIAGASTVALFALNTDWVFRSRKLAYRSLGVFASLYAFIYVLLRVEAYALLVGAVASFVAVAAAMYITRNVDWYGMGGGAAMAPAPASSRSGESWLE